MSRLIPTAIVDVNGRQTTVHKRADEAPKANGALSGVRPSLGTVQKPVSKMNTVKPKKLPQFADAVRLGKLLGALTTDDEVESFRLSSGRVPVQMSDSDVYYALRAGITMQDAAALQNLGISPDDVIERTKDSFMRGGALNKVSGRNHTAYTTAIGNALDRLESAGVSAVEADKVMTNGLQDGHFDRALNDEQLRQLFSKWRYRSETSSYEHGHIEQDDVIDGFVSGRLPLECLDNKASDLKNAENEIFDLYSGEDFSKAPWKDNPALAERLQDMDYRAALVNKAAATFPNSYRPLGELDKLVQTHGMEVLELKDPRKASMDIFVSAGVSRECGVEAARYVESVLEMAEEQTKGDFWGTSSESWTSRGSVEANGHYVRNWELIDLYEEGIPAEQAYDMLVNHGLTREQILTARETGVGSNLASGVL